LALFKRLGKVGIGLLILWISVPIFAQPVSESITIRQVSNLGFQSVEQIKYVNGVLHYNQSITKDKSALSLFQQMKGIQFKASSISCFAGSLEFIYQSRQTIKQKGCLSGDMERSLIAKLQELRFLVLRQESQK